MFLPTWPTLLPRLASEEDAVLLSDSDQWTEALSTQQLHHTPGSETNDTLRSRPQEEP